MRTPTPERMRKWGTEENFAYRFDRRFEGLVIDRHDTNGEMLRRFLDQPEFAKVFTAWARGEPYRREQQTQQRERTALARPPSRLGPSV